MNALESPTHRVSGTSTSPLDDPRVRREVLALLYSNAGVSVVMNLISVPLVWFAYRHIVPATALLSALALWTAMQFVSAWNRRGWLRLSSEQQDDPAVTTRFLLRARAIALMLSVGIAILLAVLHFAQPPATPAIAAALGLAYVLGACTSTLIYPSQVRIFSSVVLGSQAMLLIIGGNFAEWSLAAVLIALIAGLWAYAKRYGAQLQQVIVLRFEVQDLLAEQARLKDAAEAANQAKSRFFAAASHDVRQPLQALMLTFHALRHAKDETRRNQLLDNAERNLGALRQLFDQVLDISRIDAGAVPIKPEAVPLQALFEKLDARLSGEAAAKHVWLRFAPTSAVVRSDPDALERILANLVGNAIKHTERGGVWIGMRSARDRIEVRDSGIGIDAANHERIFEEFFQVDNPGRDRASGLGLGLSIVKRLCELLNHPLGLASAPGRGSMFWVGVQSTTALIVSETKAPTATTMFAQSQLADHSICLIENDEQVAEALAELLRDAGATVHAFASADAALAAAREHASEPVDAIISDYRLGSAIDGVELVVQLRAIWARDVGAIVLTGDTAIKDLARIDAKLHTSESSTHSRLLHKPVTAAQLIEAVLAVKASDVIE